MYFALYKHGEDIRRAITNLFSLLAGMFVDMILLCDIFVWRCDFMIKSHYMIMTFVLPGPCIQM